MQPRVPIFLRRLLQTAGWVALLMVAAGRVQAVDSYWLGTTSGNWGTTTNWNGTAVPANTTTVFFGYGNTTGNSTITMNGTAGGVASPGRGPAALSFNSAQDFTIYNGTLMFQQSGTGADASGIFITGNTGNVTITTNVTLTGSKNDDIILQNNGLGTLTLTQNNTAGVVSGNIDMLQEALIVNGSGNTVISNNITGTNLGPTTNFNPTSLNFQASGTGMVTLSGNNTFTGDSELDAGTLNLNSNTALGGNATRIGTFIITGGALDNTSGANVTVTNNNSQSWFGNYSYLGSNSSLGLNMGTGEVTLNNDIGISVLNGTLTENGNISGNPSINGGVFGINKLGAGTLVLGGTNTYAGNTTLAAGTLTLTNNLALQQSTLNLQGGTVNFSTLSNATFGGLAGTFGTSLALSNSTAAAVALTVGNNGSSTIFSGNMSGPGSLTKIGAGTLTLDGLNTYTGTTAVNGGTLLLDFSSAITQANITSNSSALALGGGTLSVNGNSGHTNLQAFNGTTINAGASNVSVAQNGALSMNVSFGALSRNAGGTVNFAPSGGANLSTSTASTNGNAITSGGVAYASYNGTDWATIGSAGNIVAMAAANYTTSVTAGGNVSLSTSPAAQNTISLNTLRFTGASTLTINTGSTLTLATGGLLDAANNTSADTITGGTIKGASGGELVVLQNNTSGALAINSVIADNTSATGLTKSGAGTLILGGANTYSGNTTLNQGTLQLNVGTALQRSTLNYIGGNLSFGSLTSASVNGLAGTQNLALTNNASAGVVLTVGNGTNSFTTAYSGNLSGLGNLTVNGASGSSLTLSGTNTYAGNTTISGGTLILNAAGALPTAGNVTLGNTTGASLNLNGFDANIGLLSGGGASGGNIALGSATLTTGGSNVNSTYNGVISGSGGLLKQGTGNFAIGNANTYTGTTDVDSGTLTLDFTAATSPTSNITSSSSALVLDGGTLQLNGKAATTNSQTFAGTTVNSGASQILLTTAATNPINLNLGSVTRDAGATLDVKTTGTGAGNITTGIANTAGNVVLSSNIAYLTVNGTDWATANAAGNIVAMAAANYTTNTTVSSWTGANVSLSANPASNVTANTTINTLRFTGASTITTNSGTALIIGTGGLLVSANNTGNDTITGGLLMTGYGGTANANSELVVVQNDTAHNLTISSNIIDNRTGTGSADNGMGLTKSGAGTLILNAVNTYIGNTTINAGTIQLNNGLGMQNSTVNYVGGNLSFNTGVTTATIGGLAGTQNLSLTNLGGTAVALTTGEDSFDTTYSGNINGLGSLTTVDGNITVFPTVTLLGSGNYAGTTTIGANTTLSVANLANGGSNSSIGASSNAASNLVITAGANGGALQYIGSGASTDRLFTLGAGLAGNYSTLDASGTGNIAFTNTGSIAFSNTTAAHFLNLTGTNQGNNSLAPIISDASAGNTTTVLKTGIGKWNLTAANTYTGPTIINEGTLAVSTLAVEGTGGGVASGIGASNNTATSLYINGGTLQYLGSGNTTDRLFTVGSAGATLDSSGTGALAFNNTGNIAYGINGSTAVIAGQSLTLTLSGSNTGNNSLAANITNNGSGAVSLVKSGTGLWSVTSTGNFTGSTTIEGGTLRVTTLANGGTISNLGASTNAASNLVLNGGTLQYTGAATTTDRSFSLGPWSGTLDASGTGNLTLGTAGTSVIGYTVTNTSPTLTLTGNNTGNNKLAVQVTDNGAGVVNVTKSSTGTWVLTGNNTFTGIATVNGGTMTLNASTGSALHNVSSVIVNSGGTLLLGASNQINGDALGTVAANMTLNGGTFNSGGFAQASNTLGTLTLSSTSTIDLGAGSTASVVHYDLSQTQTWVSGSTLYVTDWNGTFGIINNSTAGGGGPDQLYFGTNTTGLTGNQITQIVFVNPTDSHGVNSGNYAAEILSTGEVVPFRPVPEPATYAAGGVLTALAGWWEWRRRKALRAAR